MESTKFNTQIYETSDVKIKDSLNNDFFDLSVDLPKKENKDIIQLDKNININQSNNDFDNVIIMKDLLLLLQKKKKKLKLSQKVII